MSILQMRMARPGEGTELFASCTLSRTGLKEFHWHPVCPELQAEALALSPSHRGHSHEVGAGGPLSPPGLLISQEARDPGWFRGSGIRKGHRACNAWKACT